MSELTGDPLLDFVERLVNDIKDLGVDWHFPKNFTTYPEDDQRAYILNLHAVIETLSLASRTAPESVDLFMQGGPRPPITG